MFSKGYFAKNKINVNQKLKFDLERAQNIVGKRENADDKHFPLFPQCFSTAFFLRVVESWYCMVKG